MVDAAIPFREYEPDSDDCERVCDETVLVGCRSTNFFRGELIILPLLALPGRAELDLLFAVSQSEDV